MWRGKARVALVTGAAAGIGRETALGFAAAGASVVAADVDLEGVRETARLIQAAGGAAHFVRADVSSEGDVAGAVSAAVERFGRLDFGINNAGVEQSGRRIVDTEVEELDRILAVNVRGVLLGMKHEVRAMLRCGGGSIVNVSSIAGLIGFPGAASYVASKHAVLGLTKTAALEYARDNIRVNAVCPGAIQTDMIDRFVGRDEAAKADLIGHHPLGRIGTPAEVASAILWLCTDGAGFVTGQAVTMDGGYTVQ